MVRILFAGAFVCENINFIQRISSFKINESRYITLFAVSGSIKRLFSIDYVNIYLFSILFSLDFSRENCGVNLHYIYPDSLNLSITKINYLKFQKINYS